MPSPTVGRLAQINVNPKGGVPKHRVPSAELSLQGVSGDKQRNLRFHGGPLRAVSLFSLERIQALAAEGHPIAPGTTGENLTVSGLDWANVQPGDQLRIGEALLEVTSFTVPCQQIRGSFAESDFTRISQKLHPGWSRVYAMVLQPGTVAEGDAVQYEPYSPTPAEPG
jgi:MOSC domain-containing protein YiiM